MEEVVSQLFFFEDGFGTKYPTKADVPLKERN